MKVKTSNLIGPALDWAVAKCEHDNKQHRYGSPCFNPSTKRVYETEGLQQVGVNFAPSTDWAQGGPIIEQERIEIYYQPALEQWAAKHDGTLRYGQTPLIAAMRCYVASKLGDEVDVPSELFKE